jgi:hypothetical protein
VWESSSTGGSNRFDKEREVCLQCCCRKITVTLPGKETQGMAWQAVSPVVAYITAYMHEYLCYMCMQVACHLSSCASGVYDVRIK